MGNMLAECTSDDGKEISIKAQMKAALDGLRGLEKQAYDLLSSRVDNSFFETRQTPKPLKELAAELLAIIDGGSKSNEN